ncbi:MAG TPA: 16S rRNA (guanine(966)-N(2))-methyltransferase RsmD [Tepidisphaeraceae bacterium]|jgi:16S rRNA (guanine966-N2)-methyltransferase
MRIIAGEFRGRKLLPPITDSTRPVTDRVKQSVFDILTPLLEDAIVYDCFAGTGSMGLECLSRGAKRVTFFESERTAAARLKSNISTLKLDDHCKIITGDLFQWFADPRRTDQATLLFLDPPYRFLRERPQDLQTLAENMSARHLSSNATVIFRHDAADTLDLPALPPYDIRDYGSMRVEFLSPRTSPQSN